MTYRFWQKTDIWLRAIIIRVNSCESISSFFVIELGIDVNQSLNDKARWSLTLKFGIACPEL